MLEKYLDPPDNPGEDLMQRTGIFLAVATMATATIALAAIGAAGEKKVATQKSEGERWREAMGAQRT